MNKLTKQTTRNLLLLKAFKEYLGEIQDRLGDQWEELRPQIQAILNDLAKARDDQISLYVNRLISAGLNTPAADLIRALLQQTKGAADQVDSATRSIPTYDPASGRTRELPIEASEQTTEHVKAEANELNKALTDAGSKPRYVNLFFSDPDKSEPLAPTTPLVQAKTYTLHVHIGPERKGLRDDDTPFPDHALKEQWDQQPELPITVIVGSLDFTVSKAVDTLWLPRSGLSSEVTFPVTPRRAQGRGYLQVELLYRGHLLQSKRIEAMIVSAADAAIPRTQRPLQHAVTTFTTVTQLDKGTLQNLPARVFTVNVERDEQDNSIDIRFLDRTRGNEIAYDTRLQPAALGEAIGRIRAALKLMITGRRSPQAGADERGYEWIIDGDAAMLDNWLPLLAQAGRSLYRQLLPQQQSAASEDDRGEHLQAVLEPDAVIQVNPVLGMVTLPWALLYERRVKYVKARTRVCGEFAERAFNCVDCPHAGDRYTVCPNAFWGFRYAIEQLPCWVTGEIPRPALVQRIDNDRPLALSFNVFPSFSLWRGHTEKLRGAGDVTLFEASAIAELETVWEQHSDELGVVYFYVHGGLDEELHQPYLALSDGHITSNFLDACELDWPCKPLVFLNGCATGDYGPESYVSLIDDFRRAGACGVVGTECPVPELFAEAYAAELFPRLFRGDRLGQAMLAVRRQFLINKRNPLGLVYSLYATHEIVLAKPVSERNTLETTP